MPHRNPSGFEDRITKYDYAKPGDFDYDRKRGELVREYQHKRDAGGWDWMPDYIRREHEESLAIGLTWMNGLPSNLRRCYDPDHPSYLGYHEAFDEWWKSVWPTKRRGGG